MEEATFKIVVQEHSTAAPPPGAVAPFVKPSNASTIESASDLSRQVDVWRDAPTATAKPIESVTDLLKEQTDALRDIEKILRDTGGTDAGGKPSETDSMERLGQTSLGRYVRQIGSRLETFLVSSSRLDSPGQALYEGAGASSAGFAYLGARFGSASGGVGAAIKGLSGVAVAALGAAAALKGIEVVAGAFSRRAEEIAPYSGEIMGAKVAAEMRELRYDIREAQELGSEYAELIDAQSQLKMEFRELWLPIKKWIVGNLADFINWLRDFLVTAGATWAVTKEAMVQLPEALANTFDSSNDKGFGKLAEKVDKAFKDYIRDAMRRRDESFFDLISGFLAEFGGGAIDVAFGPNKRADVPIRNDPNAENPARNLFGGL